MTVNVLFVASECSPFVGDGDLGGMVGSLAVALDDLKISVKVLLPAYSGRLKLMLSEGQDVTHFSDLFGAPARVVEVVEGKHTLLLLDAPHLYDRSGHIYLGADAREWPDNHLRFAALAQAGSFIASEGTQSWLPDIVHIYGWQPGLLPAYLLQRRALAPPCVLTLHDVGTQGWFDASHVDSLGLAPSWLVSDGIAHEGGVGFLKTGIALSDKITTVSPSFGRDLMTPESGRSLGKLIRARLSDFSGILNGIDLDLWDPQQDPHIAAKYGTETLTAKRDNRAALSRLLGLNPKQEGPLFCVSGALTEEKGMDLVLDALPFLFGFGAQLVVLGAGDPDLEAGFAAAAESYPGVVGAVIGCDEALEHLIYAGSDAILIPSRFEPSGQTVRRALRYGTIPVAARIGGLADAIIDANPAALDMGCATGVHFSPGSLSSFEMAIERVCTLYRSPDIWSAMAQHAMRQPVGWDSTARGYGAIYAHLRRRGCAS